MSELLDILWAVVVGMSSAYMGACVFLGSITLNGMLRDSESTPLGAVLRVGLAVMFAAYTMWAMWSWGMLP